IRRCPVALGFAECDLPGYPPCRFSRRLDTAAGRGQHSTTYRPIALMASHPALSRRPRLCRVRPTTATLRRRLETAAGRGQHSTAHRRIVLLASHPALSRRPRHCRVRPTRLPAVSISVYPTRTTRAASFAGVFQVIMAICSRRGWASMVESAAVWMIGIGFVGVFVGAGQTAAWMSGRYNRMKERLEETELQRDQESQSLLQVQDELAQAQTENTRLQAQLEAERASTADKIKTLTEAREQLANQFRTLSQEVLEEKSKRFTEQNQASLKPLLDPLREHIGRFEKQVKQAYDEENRQRSALSEQIKLLQETNRHISEDATNLANALRGESKTQGNWGEMILETVLEQSGLEKGVQYDTQFATTTEDGKRRLPDAVVHLPGERSIVIDSKVSLTAYVQVHEADSEEGRRQALDAHLASVRNHLKELSDKDYQALPDINTLDYVFMFIPS